MPIRKNTTRTAGLTHLIFAGKNCKLLKPVKFIPSFCADFNIFIPSFCANFQRLNVSIFLFYNRIKMTLRNTRKMLKP